MASRDINQLKEPFRSAIKQLIDHANKAGIKAFVTDTTRTLAEQKKLVAEGKSWTYNSKHLTGEAADIAFKVNGRLSYSAALYDKLYNHVQNTDYVIWPYRDLRWGIDKPHFQYDPNKYRKDESLLTKVNTTFLKFWGRKPLEKETRYFQKRIAEGSIKDLNELNNKMSYWRSMPRVLFILEMQKNKIF